jgi:hypothetical protein
MNTTGETRIQQYRRLRSQMEEVRNRRDARWRTIERVILPGTARFQTSDTNKGQAETVDIIDNTATYAMRVMSAGMMSGMTSPSRPWFKLEAPDKDLNKVVEVRRWFADVETNLYAMFRNSNLYNALPISFLDLGAYGTHALGALEDDEEAVRFYPYPVGSYYLANNHRMVADTFAQDYQLTARQMLERFGKDNLSTVVRQAIDDGNWERPFDICQLITRNPEHDEGKLAAKYKRYRSCHWESSSRESDDKFLSESGFDEFPVMTPRWSIVGNNVWGEAPAQDVLGDVKTLQSMHRKLLTALDKTINPPLVAPSHVHLVNMLPGGITHADEREGQQSVRPLFQLHFDVSGVERQIAATQDRIRRGLFQDLFLQLANDTRSNITAQEIIQRHEEKILMLGPVIERSSDELLAPIIDRCFPIALRRGMLPPPPAELQGVKIKIVFVSIMAQAQKLLGIGSVDRFLGTVGNMAQADPSVLDKINRDKAVDYYADALGVPPDMVRSDDEANVIRQQRAQAAQKQQALANIEQAAKGAKLLSETDTRGENALSDILSQRTGITA